MKVLLQISGIPSSTYYWVKRFDRPDSNVELAGLIRTIYDEHEGLYGYPRIRDELTNHGHKVNHKKVYLIMKELGLKCLAHMKKYRSYKGESWKNCNFQAEKPNETWVTDITAFKLFGEKLYLSPIWDLFNGKIITYTIGSRPTYSLVSTMLNQSFELLHSQIHS